MTMNFEQARHNMVDNQVRTWNVVNARVLDVLGDLRREDFVPAAWRHMAFADMPLPLGHGEIMMKPVVEGRLLQGVAPQADETVLEIGTGSGFLTACLARLTHHVTSVDLHAEFVNAARTRLAAAGADNVTLGVAEAVNEYQPQDVFDVIVVGGAVHTVPDRFTQWLKPGGRMFVISGESPAMRATLVQHDDDGRFRQTSLFETDLPYLVHGAPPKRFVF